MHRLSLLCLLLYACSGPSTPDGVLPPDKMEAVLYDVIKADEWVDFAALQDSTFHRFSKRTALYDSVFQLHKISKEAFRKSKAFYESRPDLLKEIFQSMRATSDTAMKHQRKDTAIKKTNAL